MDFTSALEKLLPFIDQVYDRWEAQAQAELSATLSETGQQARASVTCRKGCGACCHFPLIPATAGEAFVLLARLLNAGQSAESLQGRFGEYARRYFEFARAQGSLPFTDAQQRAFLKLKMPCPLFVSTGKAQPLPSASSSSSWAAGHCGVFGARPLICDYYHSTEDPALCADKRPHGSFASLMQRGEEALEEIRIFERETFGRSALGHLPLLLAALCTPQGLAVFLRAQGDPSGAVGASVSTSENNDSEETFELSEAERQAWADFELYCALLACLGYDVGQADLLALAEAQGETGTRV